MNLLVSDYDGTLNPDEQQIKYLKANIKAIKDLREHGDKFMLSTGRNFVSIKKQVVKYGIKYDYLSCNDGAALFDNQDNLIASSTLGEELTEKLVLNIQKLKMGNSYSLYDSIGVTRNYADAIEIGITSKFSISKIREMRKYLKQLISDYPNLEVVSFFYSSFIETTGGKVRSIELLKDREAFDKIITVGDNSNDYEMLKTYDGYKIIPCYPCLLFKGIKSTVSVKQLVKKVIK